MNDRRPQGYRNRLIVRQPFSPCEPSDKLSHMVRVLLLLSLSVVCWGQPANPNYPNQVESDFVTHDFIFKSGEKLADLRLHYITVGTPTRDAAGHVNNAVIIMHGTGGTGRP